jgi:hypothetical protein
MIVVRKAAVAAVLCRQSASFGKSQVKVSHASKYLWLLSGEIYSPSLSVTCFFCPSLAVSMEKETIVPPLSLDVRRFHGGVPQGVWSGEAGTYFQRGNWVV